MRKFLLLATAALGATALLGGAAYAQRGGGFERGHHFQGHGHGGHGGMHRRGGRGMGGMRLLRAADADGDNNITRAEVEELQDEMFAWSDRDGDGFLTDADRSPIAQRLSAIREAERAERAERFADDEDGEPRGRGRGRGGRGARGDADGDGRISREEFGTRGLRMFDRLDEDENGVVTPAELDAAVEHRRERRERRMFWWRD